MGGDDTNPHDRSDLVESYFRKKERELIRKLEQRAARRAEGKSFAETIGIVDDDILQTLHDLGYTKNTVALLHLVPLIQVGWASGKVTTRERRLIIEAAGRRGIVEGSTAYKQLEDWFDNRPSEEFFERTLRIVGDLVAGASETDQARSRHALFTQCIRIAAASGTILGIGSNISDEELKLLEHIANVIGSPEESSEQTTSEGS